MIRCIYSCGIAIYGSGTRAAVSIVGVMSARALSIIFAKSCRGEFLCVNAIYLHKQKQKEIIKQCGIDDFNKTRHHLLIINYIEIQGRDLMEYRHGDALADVMGISVREQIVSNKPAERLHKDLL